MRIIKGLGRLRQVIFSITNLDEGLHVFKVELRRCAMTDTVTFGVRFANNKKADIREVDKNVFLVTLPDNAASTNVSTKNSVTYCTAKCKAVHIQIEALMRVYTGNPSKILQELYMLLLKKRRKMNVACFQDTWFIVKKLMSKSLEQATDILTKSKEYNVITFDFQKLSEGLHVFEIALIRRRLMDAVCFHFDTTNVLNVRGFTLNNKSILTVHCESPKGVCTPVCLAIHDTLLQFRDSVLEGDIRKGLELLKDKLAENKNIMEHDCYELIESNLKCLLRYS
jgi:hypothetical protein